MTIFAPGERLPIFATLAFCGVAGPPRTFFQDSELHASDVLLGRCFVRTNLINFIVFSRHPPKAQLEDLGTTLKLLGQYLGTKWGILGYYLDTTWEQLVNNLGTTWATLGHYLGATCAILGKYLGKPLELRLI